MMGSYTYKVNVHEEFCTLPSNITHSAVPGDEEDSSTYMAVLGLSFFHIERSIHILGTIELYVIQLTIRPPSTQFLSPRMGRPAGMQFSVP